MTQTHTHLPVPDFSEGPFFDTVAGLTNTIVGPGSSYLLALTAMILGLDVVFYRTQAAGGVSFKGVPKEAKRPVLYRMSDGRKSAHFYTSNSNRLRSSGYGVASKDKSRTKVLLHKAGISTPFGGAATARDPRILDKFAKAGINRVIAKPAKGSRGGGVLINVTLEEVYAHMSLNPGQIFLVEQIIRGTERRVLVLEKQVLAAYTRIPVHVTGDGVATLDALIADLVARQSRNPFSAPRVKSPGTHRAYVTEQGFDLAAIPEAGAVIPLEKRDYGSPADVIDCTDTLPAHTAETAIRAMRTLGGKFCGADIMETDDGEAYVLELNAKPGVARHCFPLNGAANLAAPEALIRYHFPRLAADYRTVTRFDYLGLWKDYEKTPEKQVFKAADYATFA